MSVTVSASEIGSEGISLLPGATVLKLPKNVPEASVIGDMWKKVGSGISATQSVLNQGLPTEQWTGAAADAAASEIQTLGGKLSTLATAFPKPAGELKTWDTQVKSVIRRVQGYQQEWDGAVAKYNQEIRRISDAKAASSDYDPEPEHNAAIANLRRTQQSLRAMYKCDLQYLDQEAHRAAGNIRGAVGLIIPPDVVKGGRDAIGVALCSSMPIASGAAQWAAAQHEAPQMTADLAAAANSKVPLTQAQINALQAKYGDKLQNPFYVQAMIAYYRMKHGGKDGNFADMMNRLLINTSGTYPPVPGEVATRNAFVGTLGTALVLSTGGTNVSGKYIAISEAFEKSKGMLRGPDGKTTIAEIVKTNVHEIGEVGRKGYYRFDSVAGRPKVNGFDIFTQATAYAGLNNPDLAFGQQVFDGGNDSLATQLVKYHDDEKCGEHSDFTNSRVESAYASRHPLYRGSAPASATAYCYPLIDESSSTDLTVVKQCTDPLQSLFILSDTPDSMQVEGFAAKHPELVNTEQSRLVSVRSFLNQDTPFKVTGDWDQHGGATNENISMTRYLTGSCDYAGSGYRSFVDRGDAFGKLIEDATQPLDEATKTRIGVTAANKIANSQALIVGNFAAGYQDGLVGCGGEVGDQGFGATNSSLRSHAGTILKNWVESFATLDANNGLDGAQTAHNTVSTRGGVSTVDSARFGLSKNLCDAIFGEKKGMEGKGLFDDLAFDKPKQIAGMNTPDNPFDDQFEGGRPPALQAIQTAAYVGYKYDLSQAMHDTGGTVWESAVTDSVKKWTPIFAHLDFTDSDLQGLDKDSISSRNAMIRKGVDAAWSLVPFSKMPGGQVVQVFTSTIAGEGKSSLLDQYLPTDFSSQKYLSMEEASDKASREVSDTLTSTFQSQEEWPNPEHKTKQQLIAEFLADEQGQDAKEGPVKATSDGGLPEYSAMTPKQQLRFQDFLSAHTYLKGPLESVRESTWTSLFLKDKK